MESKTNANRQLRMNTKRRSKQSDPPSPNSLRLFLTPGASSVAASDYANLLSASSRLRINNSGANDEEPDTGAQNHDTLETSHDDRRRKIEPQVQQWEFLLKKLTKLQSFWNSLTPDEKKEFLQIRVEDLRNHLRRAYSHNENIESLIHTFNEAIIYGEDNIFWEAWPCLHCDEMSIATNAEVLATHVMEKHGGGLRSFLHDDNYDLVVQWGTLVLETQWKPIHLLRALPVMERLPQDCSIQDIRNQNWPVVNDPQRAKLLDQIRDTLVDLLRKECLTPNNISTVTNFAAEELTAVLRPPQKHHLVKIARSHIPVCMLNATNLKWLSDFFRALSDACDSLVELPDKDGSFASALSNATTVQVEENLVLSDDRLSLLLDERVMTGAIRPQRYLLLPGTTSSNSNQSKAFLAWLYYGGDVSIWEELQQWEKLKEEKKNLITEFLRVYEETKKLLQPLDDTRTHNALVVNTMTALMNICEAEDVRRRKLAYQPKSYTHLMKMRLEEISGDPTSDDAKHEAGVISRLLEGFEEQHAGNSSLRQERDTLFKNYLKDIRTSLSVEWNKADLKILKIDFVMENLLIWFEQVAGIDYRAILLPVIKSYLQEQVEEKAKKKEQADAKDVGANSSVASNNSSQEYIVWFRD